MTKITGIRISRLFNLGDYENRKIEVSVEVGAGEDIRQLVEDIDSSLLAIGGKPPVCDYDLERAAQALSKPDVADVPWGDMTHEEARELIRKNDECEKRRFEAYKTLQSYNVQF